MASVSRGCEPEFENLGADYWELRRDNAVASARYLLSLDTRQVQGSVAEIGRALKSIGGYTAIIDDGYGEILKGLGRFSAIPAEE